MSVHAAHWDLPAARPLTAADAAAAQRSAFTLPRQLHDHERTTLFGLPLIKGERDHVASEIVAMAKARECSTIQFINAHCVNVAAHDAAYREALGAADFLLPDGSGLAIAARMAGLELGENLNGTDLFPDLCRHAAAAGLSIYLLGGKPGIATAAAKTMLQRYPDLVIAGTRHGYWTDEEEPALIEEINDSGAALVFVGLGVPRQEKWIARVRPELRARIVLGVGGLFDYYSGAVARAPKLFRATGMEWGWRLMQEPKRLFRRYILGNPVFLAGALQHALELRDMAKAVSASIKRAFDRALAGLALVLLSPLFLAVALAIKLEDRGPVFFRQTRIGAYGRPFRMWKFRSMVVDAEARLAAIRAQSEREGNFKMKRDPRITRIGALLRRTSVDELPQLLNIIAGEMSIVGPRPALPREVIAYDEAMRLRLGGLPGLTCTWQVSGRADIPFEQQVQLDVDYLQKRSLVGDIKLILRTIPAVVTARGAY